MALELIEPHKTCREFYGKNVEQMPKLMADNRVPLSTSGLMKKRLSVKNSNSKIKNFWMDNCFDTGDGVIYHQGKIKVVLDSEYLRNMTPKSKRKEGALILTPEQYHSIDAEEFKKGELGKTRQWLSRKEINSHPVWRILARDQALLNDYTDLIFSEKKHRFNDKDAAMGFFTTLVNGSTPEMRTFCILGLFYKARLDAWTDVNSEGGRFMGVRLEDLSTNCYRKR